MFSAAIITQNYLTNIVYHKEIERVRFYTLQLILNMEDAEFLGFVCMVIVFFMKTKEFIMIVCRHEQ